MSRAIREIQERIDRGDMEVVSRSIASWEEAFGQFLSPAVQGIRRVQGFGGFRAAAAKFARQQEFRRAGIEWLHSGIVRNNHLLIRRWRWLAASYAADVTAFASERHAIVASTETAMQAREAIKDDFFQPYAVLRANLGQRQPSLEQMIDESPRRARHNHTRILDLVLEAQRLLERRVQQTAERNLLRERTRALQEQTSLKRIAGLPSLMLQIREYQALIERAAQSEERRRVTTVCDLVLTDLRHIQEKSRDALLEQIGK
jgi:hypothetical protein